MIGRLLALLLLGAALVAAPSVAPEARPSAPIIPRLPGDALHEVMRGIYAVLEDEQPGYPTFAAVVPHHLTSTEAIAAGVRMLSGERRGRVVLLSPDHFGECPALLCVARAPFRSLLGDIRTDAAAITALARSPLVTATDAPFEREHGIGAVLPYLAHFLPDTPVVAVVVSQRLAWRNAAGELADLLGEALGPDGALLVSTDFSHFLPLEEADLKDAATIRALLAYDLPGLARVEAPAQSDCPPCLWLLSELTLRNDAPNPSVLRHTNSAKLLGDPAAAETTSHFAIAYYRNAALSPDDLSLGGDLTLTRGLPPALPEEIAAFWAGNGPRIVNLEGPLAEECELSPHPYRFCNDFANWREVADLATHWVIANNHAWDLGPEGPAETARLLSSANETALDGVSDVAGWRVVAITATVNPSDGAPSVSREGLLALTRSASGSAPVLAYVHIGTEGEALPAPHDAAFLRSLVDAGADAVVAVHSHVPGDVDVHHGRPIFRGLGNFLFDQHAEAATSTAKVVRLRAQGGHVLFQTAIAR